MHRIAHLGNVLRFRWIVAISSIANQTLTGADRVNDLGEIRGERDNAVNAQWQMHASTCFVGDFAEWSSGVDGILIVRRRTRSDCYEKSTNLDIFVKR